MWLNVVLQPNQIEILIILRCVSHDETWNKKIHDRIPALENLSVWLGLLDLQAFQKDINDLKLESRVRLGVHNLDHQGH